MSRACCPPRASNAAACAQISEVKGSFAFSSSARTQSPFLPSAEPRHGACCNAWSSSPAETSARSACEIGASTQ
eukprot:7264261-Prymnesium_polylepis.2